MHRSRLRASIACVLACSLLATSLASADPPTSDEVQKAADALFFEGRALLEKKDYAGACAKFEAARKLRVGIGTLLNLGECSQMLGKTATAWAAFRDAMYAAQAASDEREGLARERMNALVTQLVKLTIVVPKEHVVPGLVLERDGTPIDQTLWGSPVPTDPGTYVVAAKAPGYVTWSMKVTVSKTDVTTNVPLLGPESGTSKPLPVELPKTGGDAAAPVEKKSSWGTQKTVAVIVGSAGIVGLGVGATFGILSKSAHDEAKDSCNGDVCRSASGVSAADRAISRGNVSTAAFLLGTAALATGIVLYFTAPSHDEPSVGLAPSLGGATLVGAF